MPALDFPAGLIPDSQTFGIRYNTQVAVSQISGATQVVEMPGARWRGSISFRDLVPTDAADLQAFMLELRGSAGLFHYGDLSRTDPQTAVTGTLEVETGSTNRLVYTTPSTGGFTAGDYIQIGATGDSPELKMIISVSGSPGSQQSLTIEPALRRTDYLGKTIVYSNPVGEFRLINEDQLIWSVRSKAKLSDINLEFLEFF